LSSLRKESDADDADVRGDENEAGWARGTLGGGTAIGDGLPRLPCGAKGSFTSSGASGDGARRYSMKLRSAVIPVPPAFLAGRCWCWY
jgi:hypothetical protein